MTKIGLLFGSFNPIHIGHLRIGKYFYTQKKLKEIWYVLSPQNPFKNIESLAPTPIRLEMLQAAVNSSPYKDFFQVITTEMDMQSPHYTYNTLQFLKKEYPTHKFYLIMGEDNFQTLYKWYQSHWIKKHYLILTYPRHPHNLDIQKKVKSTKKTKLPLFIDISSSEIRERIKNRQSISGLVTTEVEKIIFEEKLYLT